MKYRTNVVNDEFGYILLNSIKNSRKVKKKRSSKMTSVKSNKDITLLVQVYFLQEYNFGYTN